jgi:hypothetical protein
VFETKKDLLGVDIRVDDGKECKWTGGVLAYHQSSIRYNYPRAYPTPVILSCSTLASSPPPNCPRSRPRRGPWRDQTDSQSGSVGLDGDETGTRWQLSFGTGTVGHSTQPSLTGSLFGLAKDLVSGGSGGSLECVECPTVPVPKLSCHRVPVSSPSKLPEPSGWCKSAPATRLGQFGRRRNGHAMAAEFRHRNRGTFNTTEPDWESRPNCPSRVAGARASSGAGVTGLAVCTCWSDGIEQRDEYRPTG